MNAGANAVLMAMLGGRGGRGPINGFLNSPNYDAERQKDALMNYGASLMGSQNPNNTTSGAVRQLGERLLGAVLTGYREKGYRDKEKNLAEQWGAITSRDAAPAGATMPMPKPMEGSTGDTAQDAASFEALAGGTAKGINPDDWAKRFGGATMTPKWGATMPMKKPAGVLQGMRERALLYGDRLDPKIRERMNQFELMQSMMGEDPEKPVLKEIAGRLVNVFPDGTVRELADYSEQEAALKRAGRDVNQTSVNLPPMEKEQDKVIGKELGEYPKKFYEITAKSGNKLKKIQTMNSLLEGIQTGTLSVADKKLGQMLSSLGIKWNGTNVLEAADAIANELALQARSTADDGGLPGATSDKDIDFLLSMNPSIVMTPEGRTNLERIVREDYTFKKSRFDRMNDIMRKNGGRLPTSFYQEISDYEGSNLLPAPAQQPPSGNRRFRYTMNGERQ